MEEFSMAKVGELVHSGVCEITMRMTDITRRVGDGMKVVDVGSSDMVRENKREVERYTG